LGFKIHIGQLENKEIDFVVGKEGKKMYVQVAYLINDKATRDREFGNLLSISDNYKKVVVSMDKITGDDYKGIQHLNILDFLAYGTNF
jgi:predicted AAA+ superfamily ATPase